MTRPSLDETFMEVAQVMAKRATCDRKHVGAVIVHEKHILSTGYNGSLPGQPHCDDAGHAMEHGHCVRTVHAEANAILYAARHGVEIRGTTIYTTASPCYLCLPAIIQAGLTEIVFQEVYRDVNVFRVAKENGVKLRRFPDVCAVRGHHYSKAMTGPEDLAPENYWRVMLCTECGRDRRLDGV